MAVLWLRQAMVSIMPWLDQVEQGGSAILRGRKFDEVRELNNEMHNYNIRAYLHDYCSENAILHKLM